MLRQAQEDMAIQDGAGHVRYGTSFVVIDAHEKIHGGSTASVLSSRVAII